MQLPVLDVRFEQAQAVVGGFEGAIGVVFLGLEVFEGEGTGLLEEESDGVQLAVTNCHGGAAGEDEAPAQGAVVEHEEVHFEGGGSDPARDKGSRGQGEVALDAVFCGEDEPELFAVEDTDPCAGVQLEATECLTTCHLERGASTKGEAGALVARCDLAKEDFGGGLCEKGQRVIEGPPGVGGA